MHHPPTERLHPTQKETQAPLPEDYEDACGAYPPPWTNYGEIINNIGNGPVGAWASPSSPGTHVRVVGGESPFHCRTRIRTVPGLSGPDVYLPLDVGPPPLIENGGSGSVVQITRLSCTGVDASALPCDVTWLYPPQNHLKRSGAETGQDCTESNEICS